ncbi:MAG: hypothetical protein ACJ8FY_22770 [Gemmataceae bacterium]
MLVGGSNFPQHRPWIVAVALLSIVAGAWFALAGIGKAAWPGGSSLPGFTFGVAGGLLILFEFLLWPRKKLRTWRIGQTKVWMRAHIWLGLLTVPLLVLHSGFNWGGSLSAVLLLLLFVVVASGIWGLVLQQLLPTQTLHEISAETIHSQVEQVMKQFTHEAERLVNATCGYLDGATDAEEEFEQAGSEYMTLGAVRSVGKVQGKVLMTRVPKAPVPGAEPLRNFFENIVHGYLSGGKATGSALQYPLQAATIFADMRTKLVPEAHAALDTLEDLCNQRRQLDRQRRLHFWLHNWLLIHLPLSAALVVLMFVHVWVALKYW